MWPFRKKHLVSTGIDIGTSSIKVVQLRKKGEQIELAGYGELSRTNDDSSQANFPKLLDEQVVQMIQFVLREARIEPVSAVLSVPVNASFITTIDMPVLSPDEIAKAIPFEARQYVPVPISEVMLDWSIIKTDKLTGTGTKQTKIQVLLVATPKDVIERYTRIAQLAKIQLEALETEPFSVVRAVAWQEQRPMLILDIGARSSSVTIVDEGTIRFTHGLEVSGKNMTRTIAQSLQITWDRAEAIKRDQGLASAPGQDTTANLLRAVLDTILTEVDSVSRIYLERSGREIHHIVLTGGSAQLPGLPAYLSQKLAKEVVVGNPFASITVPADLRPVLAEIGPSFAVAVGLALHNLVGNA